MTITSQIAKHLREVYFGKNWTVSNLRQHLEGVTWQQATTKIGTLNTIAALVYHMNYYVIACTRVMQGKPIDAKDEFSFNLPPILSGNDWNKLQEKTWTDAETLAALIESMDEELLWKDFVDKKYGNYYRNLHGIVEHNHYHLGQIVVIKKMILEG